MFWRRLGYLLPWRRRAAERDMHDELRTIAGMADPRELGNLTLAAEDARAEWGWIRLEQTVQDVKYALRTLRKNPVFSATAIVSLAIGIGANTALFTLVNTVAWKALPVADPEHLIQVNQLFPGAPSFTNGFTYQQYQSLRDHAQGIAVAAYSRVSLNVTIDGGMEPTTEGQLVSGSYFPLLGLQAFRGRLLGPEDDRVPSGHPIAVISHEYWKSRFVRDPNMVGKRISLSGVSFTVVGVTPPGFFGVEVGSAPKIFVPVMMQPVVMPITENLIAEHPNLFSTFLRVIGRLKPGVGPAEARARLDALSREIDEWKLRDKFSGKMVDLHLGLTSATTGLSDLRAQFSTPLFVLIAVVGIVLLIACANTGNLVLVRSAARRPEFALRLTLGAGRSRLMRQVLVEGLVLAAFAGVVGALLAFWATSALVTYAAAGRGEIALDLSPDLRVLSFTAGVSAVAGLIFAMVPALRASRVEAVSGSAGDLGRGRDVLGRRGPAKLFVVLQVALSLVLLAGSALFVRSLQNLNRQDAGVDRASVIVVRVEPRGSDQRGIPGTTDRLDRIYRDLLGRVERLHGVQSATLARTSPLTPLGFATRAMLPSGEVTRIPVLMIYPHYFSTMGLPILSGRDFNDDDLRPESPLVVLVNEAFVKEFLNGTLSLGTAHHLVMPTGNQLRGQPPQQLPIDIIGLVRNSPYPDLRAAAAPLMYQTFRQTSTGRGQMVLHVRVAGNVGDIARQVRAVVQAIDPDVPLFKVHTLADEVDAVLVQERLIATLSTFFSVVALLLVCVGLYGLMAYTVSRRTAEIGIRMALGANRADVRWMIARQTLTLVLMGTAIGLPAAWMAGRLAARQISGLLFKLTPSDAATMAGATVLLVIVAAAAGLLPARRAARIDPIVALRTE